MKNRDKIFEYYKCREVELTFSAPQQICVDGELETCDSLRMSVEQNAIRVVNPILVAAPETFGKEVATV